MPVRMAATALQFGLILCYSLFTFTLLVYIYKVQPSPYLDEVFHIPQAEQYCNGIFDDWDPKLTTLPGLYLLSIGILVPLSRVLGRNFCDVFGFRCINFIASIGIVFVLWGIGCTLHRPKKGSMEWKVLVSSVTMSMLPVLYFFTFLYYTDVVSTFLVLLMYLLHLEKERFWAAGIGLVAVCTRQTNIVWVVFVAVLSALEAVKIFLSERNKRLKQKSSKRTEDNLWAILQLPLGQLLQLQIAVIQQSVGYIAVGMVFGVFLLANNGIAVGDRSAHEVVFHLPQIFYFAAFTSFFCFPYFVAKTYIFLRDISRNYVVTGALLLVLVVGVYFNTMAHPYLLADNRHYTFYVWKRVIEKFFLTRYLLTSVYLVGFYCMYRHLKYKGFNFLVTYTLCTALCLVPQKLLEFRYYIIPYLLFRLQVQPDSWQKLAVEFLLYISVNVATIYMFTQKPFYWPHIEGVQRFLW